MLLIVHERICVEEDKGRLTNEKIIEDWTEDMEEKILNDVNGLTNMDALRQMQLY